MADDDMCFKNAQHMITDSSSLLENIMHSMGDGLSIQDLNLRIVYQNKMMIDNFGSHIGERCYKIYEKRDKPCDGCPIRQAFRTGKVTKALRVGITADGTSFRFENIASVLRNDCGEIVAGMELCRLVEDREQALDKLHTTMQHLQHAKKQLSHDIAERKRIEVALQETKNRLTAVIDTIPDLIWLKDSNGVYLACNPEVELLFNAPVNEILGKTDHDFLPRQLAEWLLQKDREAVAADRICINEEEAEYRSNGRHVVLETRRVPVRDVDGGVLGVLGIGRDISERKQAEQERAENEAMLASILNGIQAAFFIVEPVSLLVEEANKQAATLLGKDISEIIGRPCSDTLLLSACKAISCKKCVSKDWDFLGNESTLTLEDETVIPVSMKRLQLRKGGRNYMAIILFDISERKALEIQLSYAQKLESIGQLAAGIAHEINTPIQYVADNIQFLQSSFNGILALLKRFNELYSAIRDNDDAESLLPGVTKAIASAKLDFLTEEIPKAISDSQEGVGRVAMIVMAMKKFSHPDMGVMKPLMVNDAVQNTIIVARNEWKYASELTTELAEDLPPIQCIPGDFNQAMLNVLVNAAHANSDKVKEQGTKEKITVRTARVGDFVEIQIQDTGIGIPEKNRSRIFDPFFTTKEVGKGTGQGLAITHSIVAKHGGTITFESKVGAGTTFTMRFPIEQSESTKEPS